MICGLAGAYAQNTNLSGYVEDAQTGERLLGVNLHIPGTTYGTTTNKYGFYSLPIPGNSDTVVVQVSYVGYKMRQDTLLVSRGGQKRNFIIYRRSTQLQEVEVTGQQSKAERVQMSQIDLKPDDIKNIPMLLGEVDVFKSIQLLPGVQSGNEGTTGLYVRGGSPDQNLILLDGVPVYNASHLFGFFSVFNADAIKNVSLTKGGFPARYGGRLSSVLEIDMKEGNTKEFHGEGAVGIIASRLTLEGPIVKDKTSFMISGRRTYADLLFRPFFPSGIDGGYYFFDLNAKVNHRFSDKDRLFLSYYTGVDRFFSQQEFDNPTPVGPSGQAESYFEANLRWGNHTGALRWNHLFNDKLFSNLTATFTQYRLGIGAEQEFVTSSGDEIFNAIEYFSLIRDYGLRYDLEHNIHRDHKLRYGLNYTHHTFRPGAVQVEQKVYNNNIDSLLELSETVRTHDLFAYVEDQWQISPRLKANTGLHYALYHTGNATYQSLQPRLSARYLLRDNWSLKASYAQMSQFIHLLSNTGLGLPTDLWVSSTEKVKPQQSRQVALGSSYSLDGGDYEISLEGYYKWMENLIAYKPGASFLSNRDWQENVETDGQGAAYGIEFLFRKNSGKTTGWIGYTLAWSNRQFSNLNKGEPFPYRYDRRHDVSIVLNHRFSEHFDLGLTWVYGSGNTFTAPIANVRLQNPLNSPFSDPRTSVYTSRNGLRMPAYHRLDIGLNWHKKTSWGERTWSVSVYNAYSRQNPYFIYVGRGPTGQKSLRQVSLFPIIPSVSYSFKF